MLQLWVNFLTLMVPCFRYTNDNNVRWHTRGFELRNILLSSFLIPLARSWSISTHYSYCCSKVANTRTLNMCNLCMKDVQNWNSSVPLEFAILSIYLEHSAVNYVSFKNLSTAFDTINHDNLLVKLIAYGLSNNALKLMCSI